MAAATAFAVVAGYGGVLVVGTVVAGVGVLITVLQQTLAVPLMAALRLGWITTLDLVRNALMVTLVVILAAAGAGLIPIFAAAVPVAIVVLGANVVLVRGQVPLRPAFERAEWSRVVRLSVTYAAATAVGTIYLLITVVLTSLVGTSHETGYYGISFRIFLVVVNIPVLIVTSALPVLARAARDDPKRLSYALQRLLEIGAILGVWIALVLIFGAKVAIGIVGGREYAPAVGVLQIQSVAIIGTFIAFTLGFVLLSLGQSRALLIANVLALALSITLTLALVPSVGAKGAAAATVAGEFALALFYGVALFGRRLVSGVSGRFVGPVALAAAPAAALVLIPGLRDIPLVLAATAVYFADSRCPGRDPGRAPGCVLGSGAGPNLSEPRRALEVGLNLLFLTPTAAGAGRYATELLPALLEAEPDLRLTGFVGADAPPTSSSTTGRVASRGRGSRRRRG